MMSYSARETEASSESHLALLRVATDGTFSGSCVCYHLKTVFPFIQKSNRETRAQFRGGAVVQQYKALSLRSRLEKRKKEKML